MHMENIVHVSVFNKFHPSAHDAPDSLYTTKSSLCGTQTHHLSSSSLVSILSLLLPSASDPHCLKRFSKYFITPTKPPAAERLFLSALVSYKELPVSFSSVTSLVDSCGWCSVISLAKPLQLTQEGLERSRVSFFP